MEYFLKDLYFKLNKETRELVKEDCYVAGGALYSLLTGKNINDIDIYFKSREAMLRFLKLEHFTDSYVPKELLKFDEEGNLTSDQEKAQNWNKLSENKIRSINENEVLQVVKKMNNKSGFDLFYCNEYAGEHKTFMGHRGDKLLFPKSITYKVNNREFQFILRFQGEPKEMMNSTFDFNHVKVAYDIETKKFIYCDGALDSINKGQIEYVNSYYPMSSLKRLFKYEKRGMYYDNETFVKILKDIRNIDIDDELVVLDQISGYYDDTLENDDIDFDDFDF